MVSRYHLVKKSNGNTELTELTIGFTNAIISNIPREKEEKSRTKSKDILNDADCNCSSSPSYSEQERGGPFRVIKNSAINSFAFDPKKRNSCTNCHKIQIFHFNIEGVRKHHISTSKDFFSSIFLDQSCIFLCRATTKNQFKRLKYAVHMS